MTARFDKLGMIIVLLIAYGVAVSPFATFRANRIIQGEPRAILEALSQPMGFSLIGLLLAVALIALFKTPTLLRLAASLAALLALAVFIGLAATYLTPPENSYARVSPASGFWLLSFSMALLTADAFTRLRPSPRMRIAVLIAVTIAIGYLLVSGSWSSLSILKEYANRADTFWNEAAKHLTLALGSLFAAVIVGVPLGVLCHRVESVRPSVLNVLNIIQTIPSIALFGLLIAPLGWIALNVPGASTIGIRGIGVAPAFFALFLYSLLPVVSNTVVGLGNVPRDANEAARGIGMTDNQRLFGIEFPLAMPVILTGIRIVLVQNIGLATIAALIGGGGFGVFVFQGIGQTAMDLVLLGAVPTVALAFAAAIVFDAIIEMTTKARDRTA